MLYNIIIAPIETIVEWVFLFIRNKFSSFNVIWAISGVSLAINFLALPLYNIADRLQEKERRIQKSLDYRVKRIKKGFKGDMQFMMISEYYRQNNYHPLFVLRSSLSILIEIPFFIAAYHFLSNCPYIADQSWWIFKDLGQSDSLICFSLFGKTVVVNILPILMTLINFVSGAVYLKDAPIKEKIQLYGVAIVFLVLLYNSPSGLVIYWILNNLFSLGKNIVMKSNKKGLILHIILSSCVFGLAIMFCFFKENTVLWKKFFITFIAIIFACIPMFTMLLRKTVLYNQIKSILHNSDEKQSFILFIFSCIALWLICGLLLPTSVISSSPIEFSYIGNTKSPLTYIYSALTFFFGLCVFWPFIIYKMFGKKVKLIMPILFFVLTICSLCNVYIFKPDYGTIDNLFNLSADALTRVPKIYFLLPLIVACVCVVIILFLQRYKKIQWLVMCISAICIATVGLSVFKISSIKKSFDEYTITRNEKLDNIKDFEEITPVYHLSKTQENIIVLFLDRAIGAFAPHIFSQFPALQEDFSGFVYYPNTLSSGGNTINGFPPITGGYEYTSEEIHKRKDELLVDKHNEALKVMPKIFMDGGYDVTYTDPSMSNYAWSGDLSPFDEYPQMHVSTQFGLYTKRYAFEKGIELRPDMDKETSKQMKNFSVLQIMYPFLRTVFYNSVFVVPDDIEPFVKHISNLYYLNNLTDFNNPNKTLTIIENEVTHRPTPLLPPDYEIPANNRKEIERNNDYKSFNDIDLLDYGVNIAAYKQIAKYLKFLKDNDVYDNTRIIIVSDHGFHHHYTAFDNFEDPIQPSSFNCLLMVKDFNATGKVSSNQTFMTNADTLFLAKEGLNLSDVNPFTGKKLIQQKEYVICCPTPENQWNVTNMINKTQFDYSKGKCWKVHDNIFDPENWEPYVFPKGENE